MTTERRTIQFSGRVQGVGFRMTAVHLAHDLQVTGTVQNLPDGRVELQVQGPAPDLDRLLDRLREHFQAHIRTMDQTRGPPLPPLSKEVPFGIRVTS